MRGEDSIQIGSVAVNDGSPPHARGRRGAPFGSGYSTGITPACAGKTRTLPRVPRAESDHPRMRGEDDSALAFCRYGFGSPPHARGRQILP